MPRRIVVRGLVLALILALAATGIAVAAKAPKQAPKQATVLAKGGIDVKINRGFSITFRFAPAETAIRSGGTVTVKNRTDAPHTLSLVKRSQLPRSLRQLESCDPENAGSVCATIVNGHQFSSEDKPPQKPVVDVGATGFDQAGDSVFIAPKQTVKIKITARKGSNLRYLCAFHPWMQGSFKVR